MVTLILFFELIHVNVCIPAENGQLEKSLIAGLAVHVISEFVHMITQKRVFVTKLPGLVYFPLEYVPKSLYFGI